MCLWTSWQRLQTLTHAFSNSWTHLYTLCLCTHLYVCPDAPAHMDTCSPLYTPHTYAHSYAQAYVHRPIHPKCVPSCPPICILCTSCIYAHLKCAHLYLCPHTQQALPCLELADSCTQPHSQVPLSCPTGDRHAEGTLTAA